VRPSQIIADIQAKTRCSYVATEALYRLWGKENGYTPMRVDAHWFLEHRPSGFIIDVLPKGELDYEKAVPGKFKSSLIPSAS
jgi:hypothetical protein